MMLARIELGHAHADLRTFECPACEHVHKVLVEDSMNSGNAGWQDGDLKPPPVLSGTTAHLALQFSVERRPT